MKAVILAGGAGSRLGNLTKNIPKPLIPIGGKPVLEHQLLLLKNFGVKEIYICTGYLGEKIHGFCGNGGKWGLNTKFSHGDVALNTADRVAQLSAKIKEDFVLLYGDVMMDFDISRLIKFHHNNQKRQLATLAVHPNNHPFDSDLVETDKDYRIVKFYPKPHPDNKFYQNLVNAGAYILSPKIFSMLKKNPGADFGTVIFPRLLQQGRILLAYKTPEYFKDMGTLPRLKQVRADYKNGIIKASSLKHKRPAVFLDRDGVLNKEVDQLRSLKQLQIYPFAGPAVRLLNDAGFLTVVVTNQPQIARGYIVEDDLKKIHNKLEWELGKQGAKLDAIYYCPHHLPDKTVTNPVKKFAVACDCRKPKIGMIKNAVRDLNIDLAKSFFIGDSSRDAKTAENARLKFLGVKTGYACRDNNFTTKKPYKIYKNLLKAVKTIVKKQLDF